MRKRLSKLDDWKLTHRNQDIRGHKMMDADGETVVGVVDDLIVNTDTELVETIVLEDGTEYGADEIEIDHQRAYLKGTAAKMEGDHVVRVYDDARVQKHSEAPAGAAAAPAFAKYEDDFRKHHGSTYSDSDYADYKPAYRYGYRYGTSEEYRDREYSDLEAEMRRDYEREHGEGTWSKVKGAVRHAFDRGRTHHEEADVRGATGSDYTASGNPGSAVRGDGNFSDLDRDFRKHHSSAYDDDDYATYEPAYRHGYRYGTSEEYHGREYSDVEPELRRSYEREHGEGTWEKVKDAVRHAFTTSRSRRGTT